MKLRVCDRRPLETAEVMCARGRAGTESGAGSFRVHPGAQGRSPPLHLLFFTSEGFWPGVGLFVDLDAGGWLSSMQEILIFNTLVKE